MSANIQIEPFKNFKESLAGYKIHSISNAAQNGSKIILVTNQFYPLLFDIESNSVRLFQGKPKSCPNALCVDISSDGNYIVTGHDDGSVNLWAISENYMLVKSHQKIHKDPIIHIKFGHENTLFYAVSSTGVVTQISFVFLKMMTTFKEKLIYQSHQPIQDLILSKVNDPFPIGFIVFPTSYCIFDPKLLESKLFSKNQNESCIVFQSEKYFDPPYLSLLARNSDYFLSLASGNKIKMHQITSPTKVNTIFNDIECSNGKISFSIFISSTLIVVITNSGAMELMTCAGEKVTSSTSEEIAALINSNRSVLTYSEKVILVTVDNIQYLSFSNWKTVINDHAQHDDWDFVFQSLTEVYLDTNRSLVGVPSKHALRIREVKEISQELLRKYFVQLIHANPTDFEEQISNKIIIAASLGVNSFVENEIYGLFEKERKLPNFYNGIFLKRSKALPEFCTPVFIRKYIEYYKQQDQISRAEESLVSLQIKGPYVQQLIQIANEYRMLNLCKDLSIRCLGNYLIPCILFYEEGKLDQFFNSIYSNNLIPEGSERSLYVWLVIPDKDNKYPRLKNLLQSDWAKGALLIKRIYEACPIQYTFTQKLTRECIIDIMTRILDDQSYEIAQPYLSYLLPTIPTLAEKEKCLTGVSVHHIIRWIFTSNEQPSEREVILQIFLNRYPNVLPPSLLVQWCENAGFTKLVQKFYLENKDYDKIIASMILNPQTRENIFDFIDDHVDDHAEMEAGVVANFDVLLLIDKAKTVQLIIRSFIKKQDKLIAQLSPQHRLIYLKALMEFEPKELDQSRKFELFQLICEYDSTNASRFMKENFYEMDIEKMTEYIEKHEERVDCRVLLYYFNQQYAQAAELIGKEIENSLLNFIESDSKVNPQSIDELVSIPELEETMQAINDAFDILTRADNRSTKKNETPESQCEAIYMYFQFPMYRAAQKSENINKTVTLVFSYFLVSSLSVIKADHAFAILGVHFSTLDEKQYHQFLSNVFARIEYIKNLDNSLEDMMIIDCLNLVDKAHQRAIKGIQSVMTTTCSSCQDPLMKTGESFTVFPCGHCFHNTQQCKSSFCTICHGGQTMTNLIKENEGQTKLTQRRIQQLMRRMDFSLKKNFGEDADKSSEGSSIFFMEREEESYMSTKVNFFNISIPDDSISPI